MLTLTLNPSKATPPLVNASRTPPEHLTPAISTKSHGAQKPAENDPARAPSVHQGSIRFVGTATTLIEYAGVRIMTDPNFLHAGDHVHLGPGVTGTRQTNPALEMSDLPALDLVLLSHYHGDHFDQDVEANLTRTLPIITTPHATAHLSNKGAESFNRVTALDFWDSAFLPIDESPATDITKGQKPALKVTGMPGKHVPPGALEKLNDIAKAVPPTNGWMLELGRVDNLGAASDFHCHYRIYISGDTLLIDELKDIPKRYAGHQIDLMLVHLGGTTIPGPKAPLLMVTMDGAQGIELVKLISPEVTIPIHYDDYDVFLSPLEDFQKKMAECGLADKGVYLSRGDEYRFAIK